MQESTTPSSSIEHLEGVLMGLGNSIDQIDELSTDNTRLREALKNIVTRSREGNCQPYHLRQIAEKALGKK